MFEGTEKSCGNLEKKKLRKWLKQFTDFGNGTGSPRGVARRSRVEGFALLETHDAPRLIRNGACAVD